MFPKLKLLCVNVELLFEMATPFISQSYCGLVIDEPKVAVKLIDTKFYISEGKSKKDAEQNAAILCLKNIKKIWFGMILDFYYQKINIMKIH